VRVIGQQSIRVAPQPPAIVRGALVAFDWRGYVVAWHPPYVARLVALEDGTGPRIAVGPYDTDAQRLLLDMVLHRSGLCG